MPMYWIFHRKRNGEIKKVSARMVYDPLMRPSVEFGVRVRARQNLCVYMSTYTQSASGAYVHVACLRRVMRVRK